MFLKERLLSTRKAKNMSLEMVAQGISALGYPVSRQSVFNWERGLNRPQFEAILFIAKLFKKNAQYFFDLSVK